MGDVNNDDFPTLQESATRTTAGKVPIPKDKYKVQQKFVDALYDRVRRQKAAKAFPAPANVDTDPDFCRAQRDAATAELKYEYRKGRDSSNDGRLVDAFDGMLDHATRREDIADQKMRTVDKRLLHLERHAMKKTVRIIGVPRGDDKETLESKVAKVLKGACKLPDNMADNVIRNAVEIRREMVGEGQAPVLLLECARVCDARKVIAGSRKHSKSWRNPWNPDPRSTVQCVASLVKEDYENKQCAITLMRLLLNCGKFKHGKVELFNKVSFKIDGKRPEHFSKFLEWLPEYEDVKLFTSDRLEEIQKHNAYLNSWTPNKRALPSSDSEEDEGAESTSARKRKVAKRTT